MGGHCINTIGSYYCSCAAPLVLDPSQRRCVTNESHGLGSYSPLFWPSLAGGPWEMDCNASLGFLGVILAIPAPPPR